MNKLQETSMLVDLKISQWKGTKLDREISKEIETNHTVTEAGNYNKRLVTADDLKTIRHAARALRDFHVENTLPWSDTGERMLPSANYFTYIERVTVLRYNFDNAVSSFINNYDLVILNAKVRLNGLFRAQDYPKAQDLPDKFRVKSTFLAVPDTDFRLNLDSDELQRLKEGAEEEITNRVSLAQADNWERVKKHLLRMKGIFTSDSAPIFNTLFDDLSELIELLPKLNIAGDEHLTEACTELKKLLVPADELRKHKELRTGKAEEVEAMLSKFKSFF